MEKKVVRTKTSYKNIYYNESTQKYDVKYNYKIYDLATKKNKYKAKWSYNIPTITAARAELAKLQMRQNIAEDKEITLQGAHEIWKIKAQGQNYSVVTLRNTEQQMDMIYKFIPKDTKLRDITEDVYYKFSADCRAYGYSEETLRSINATFRKMLNLSYKKKLLKENMLHSADNIRTKQKDEYKILTKEEFDKLDEYFATHSFCRLGEDNYPRYRLLFNVLYYCGLRIGEALALTYEDFEEFNVCKKDEELHGYRLRIVKAYVTEFKLTKSPKNLKHRKVPLCAAAAKLFVALQQEHTDRGGSPTDRVFSFAYGACVAAISRACAACGITQYSCHEFRHTFISNLIKYAIPLPVIEKVSGDTQETILKRYSHMFESDEFMILTVMNSL